MAGPVLSRSESYLRGIQRSPTARIGARLAAVVCAAGLLFVLGGWQIALIAVVLTVPLFDLDPWPVAASGVVWLVAALWSALAGYAVGLSPVTGLALLAVAAWPARRHVRRWVSEPETTRTDALALLRDLPATLRRSLASWWAWVRRHPVRVIFLALASATSAGVVILGGATATALALALVIAALSFGMDGRWAVGLGLAFLASAPLLLAWDRALTADSAATTAYYFFALGTALLIRDQIVAALPWRRRERDGRTGPEP